MTRGPDWRTIGRWTVITGLLVAGVVFFALHDYRWIAGVILGVAVLDALIFWVVMPRLGERRP